MPLLFNMLIHCSGHTCGYSQIKDNILKIIIDLYDKQTILSSEISLYGKSPIIMYVCMHEKQCDAVWTTLGPTVCDLPRGWTLETS